MFKYVKESGGFAPLVLGEEEMDKRFIEHKYISRGCSGVLKEARKNQTFGKITWREMGSLQGLVFNFNTPRSRKGFHHVLAQFEMKQPGQNM